MGEVVLCTNFTDFASAFGVRMPDGSFQGFTRNAGQNILAHAVRGFFNNGGTRCYVTRVAPTATTPSDAVIDDAAITDALALLEPIDEISIIAAPGLCTASHYAALTSHVTTYTANRFAIFDTKQSFDGSSSSPQPTFPTELQPPAEGSSTSVLPPYSDAAALYFPWLQVFDPATRGSIYVPPSGHMAGIYASVDGRRGVFKAPANVPVLGVTDLRYAVSPRQHDGLNPQGVNCIRKLNGNILVWGARTLGGNDNADFKYINVRRTFNYIRASIDAGTQWAVFEPNNSVLWARITREVSAFLRTLWASGGLFGDKPEQAFYVKCDAETNPPSGRDAGMVVTEIGVAIVRPAEFVVFRLGQMAGQAS
ncbi:Phage tail sheath protein FI [Minicystis rosea]|nr:Phage tail sheath protein FI [Minicystis rosea]